MSKLSSYEGFIAQVEELGFLPLSHLMDGLPSLSDFVDRSQWHTGDAQTDPWLWKDRAAAEKRLAYGCILNGHKGFVAGRLYAWFYAAYHPTERMPERWAAGLVSQPVWRIWQLFESKTLLNTAEVRAEMGGSRVDASLKELQRLYFLTVAGVRQKIAHNGKPYGWPAEVYDRPEHWSPPGWLADLPNLDPREARETVLAVGLEMGKDLERSTLAKKLGLT